MVQSLGGPKPTKATPGLADPAPPAATEAMPIAAVPLGPAPKVEPPPAALPAIATEFGPELLAALRPRGRSGQGFRLDGGGLRLMWMSARPIEKKDGTPGAELLMFAQGPTLDRLAARLKAKKGSATGKLDFRESTLEARGDRTVLKDGKSSWSPTGAKTLRLSTADAEVELVPEAPVALKGALRLRVFGAPEAQAAALKALTDELGLHGLFAPPSPSAEARLKLIRLLWSTDPAALERLKVKSVDQIHPNELAEALAAAGVPEADVAAVDGAGLTKLAEVLGLASLLAARSPDSLVGAIEKAKAPLALAAGTPALEAALADALGALSTPAATVAAAAGRPIEPDADRHLLRFGLLAARAPKVARELTRTSVSEAPLARVQEVAAELGLDPAGDRAQSIGFVEVYPGYFTAYDLTRVAELREAGAAYLYSTADTPARVLEILEGGQKSSFARFSEGLIIPGKSSDRDFETGGAFSIFTRLVTESAIRDGRSGSSSATFHNWGGSRPYKLILNRRMLGRLDWYGYNGDNFGRSTGLTKANHGAAIVKTIDKNYSKTNELMFGMGNAPSNVDLVVCETEDQRKKLLDALAARGITSFSGRPVADFVRVEKFFFRHPDDVTPEAVVEDAVASLTAAQLRGAILPALEARRAAATAAALERATAAEAKGPIATAVESAISKHPEVLGNLVVKASDEAAKQALPEGLSSACAEATAALAAELAPPSLDRVRGAIEKALEAERAGLVASAGPAAAAALAAVDLKAALAKVHRPSEKRNRAIAAMTEALTPALSKALKERLLAAGPALAAAGLDATWAGLFLAEHAEALKAGVLAHPAVAAARSAHLDGQASAVAASVAPTVRAKLDAGLPAWLAVERAEQLLARTRTELTTELEAEQLDAELDAAEPTIAAPLTSALDRGVAELERARGPLGDEARAALRAEAASGARARLAEARRAAIPELVQKVGKDAVKGALASLGAPGPEAQAAAHAALDLRTTAAARSRLEAALAPPIGRAAELAVRSHLGALAAARASEAAPLAAAALPGVIERLAESWAKKRAKELATEQAKSLKL